MYDIDHIIMFATKFEEFVNFVSIGMPYIPRNYLIASILRPATLYI